MTTRFDSILAKLATPRAASRARNIAEIAAATAVAAYAGLALGLPLVVGLAVVAVLAIGLPLFAAHRARRRS